MAELEAVTARWRIDRPGREELWEDSRWVFLNPPVSDSQADDSAIGFDTIPEDPWAQRRQQRRNMLSVPD